MREGYSKKECMPDSVISLLSLHDVQLKCIVFSNFGEFSIKLCSLPNCSWFNEFTNVTSSSLGVSSVGYTFDSSNMDSIDEIIISVIRSPSPFEMSDSLDMSFVLMYLMLTPTFGVNIITFSTFLGTVTDISSMFIAIGFL